MGVGQLDVCKSLGAVVEQLRSRSPSWSLIEEHCRSALVASEGLSSERDIEQLVTFCMGRDVEALRNGAMRVLLMIGENQKQAWD